MSILKRGLIKCMAGLMLYIPMSALNAGDEDMNPTAYQRFDPETGFMIPIQPHEAQQQTHDQAAQGTSSVAQTPDTTPTSELAGSTDSNLFWIYLLGGISLLAGLAAWIRSKKVKTTPSHLD